MRHPISFSTISILTLFITSCSQPVTQIKPGIQLAAETDYRNYVTDEVSTTGIVQMSPNAFWKKMMSFDDGIFCESPFILDVKKLES